MSLPPPPSAGPGVHPPPPPPPGPGVHPPFPAPPIEGRGKRIGTSVGIVIGIVVLVCGGGAVAGIGLATSITSALDEQADVVVGHYLDDIRERDFNGAYQQLCQDARDVETQSDFTERMESTEPFQSYRLGDLSWGVRLTLPVDLIYSGGGSQRLRAELVQNRSTGKFEVCDLGE